MLNEENVKVKDSEEMKLSQHFNVENNDAFFYFSRVINEEGVSKLVPFLLTNKKEEIRLDTLLHEAVQPLPLIKDKYMLTTKSLTTVMNPLEISIQPHWVDKWQAGKIVDEEIRPSQIIKEIEVFIQRFCYIPETSRKVLALWIFSTYFYTLFKSGFPLLHFSGEAGTGKTVLETLVYLLSLNGKFATNMTEAALFVTSTFEGRTLIISDVDLSMDTLSEDKIAYTANSESYTSGENYGGRFSKFCPKVTSHVKDVADILADRCIQIRTTRVDDSKLINLESLHDFEVERRNEIHSITSRAVLCALTHFEEAYELFNQIDSNIPSSNARLKHTLKPLRAVAKLVGGDYEKHLLHYFIDAGWKNTTWDEKVSLYIENNLKTFIHHFFPQCTTIPLGMGIRLNPSPCCGHNDCFGFNKLAPLCYCFSCDFGGNARKIVEKVYGKEQGRKLLGEWSGIPYEGTNK